MFYCYNDDLAACSNFPIRNQSSEKSSIDLSSKTLPFDMIHQKCETFIFSVYCLIQKFLCDSGGVGNWYKILHFYTYI